ncbi:hypothetical protein [Enterococcus sp. LJL90]
MEFLDWLFIIMLSLAILCVLFALFCLVSWIANGKSLKKLKKKRPAKKRIKRWRRACREIEKKKKRFRTLFLIFLILGAILTPVSLYIRYYQATTLSTDNSDALVQGYMLTQEIENNIGEATTTDNPEELQATIYDVAARLASYGTETPDSRLSQEGKLLLTDLFQRMKRLGINLSGISIQQLQVPEQNKSYLSDIERLKNSQEKVFEYFRIDQASLAS